MTAAPSAPVLRVLHLDDDPFELERVQHALERHSLDCAFQVESVATVSAYRARLAVRPTPDVAILDIHIDDTGASGITLAEETQRLSPRTVILMCSTADDIGTIADCLSAGADDFISKLSDKGELSLRVYNSYRLAKLKQGGDVPGTLPSAKNAVLPVGETMTRAARRVPMILGSAITAVFIRGESGTGKEVVADLFGAGAGSASPFVKVNCGAIAPSLLESELFGHVKGAFTGAAGDKRGLLEAASGGWIFLDEVATLSPSAQVALLRVVENQEVLRVGATKPTAISVRVLSATNEPMERLTREGKFRADLWQRLREAEILLPPLRDRAGEIPALVEHFCRGMPGGPYEVTGPVMDILRNVSWREGNVRELRNCLRAMTELHVNKLLTPLGLPERIWEELGERPEAAPREDADAHAGRASGKAAANAGLTLPWDRSEAQTFDYLADLLLLTMTQALVADRGKLSLRALATSIGMSRSTLSSRLKALVHKNMIDITELSRLVGIIEK